MAAADTAHPAGATGLSRRAARLGELLAVAVLAVIAARALWFVAYGPDARPADIEPAGLQSTASAPSAVDLSALERVDLFAPAAGGPASEALPETQLNLTLRGVRRGAAPGTGSAVIETPGQGQRTLPLGAEIVDGVTLEEIYEERVVINRRGARENLFLREEARQRAQASLIRSGGASAPADETPAPERAEPAPALSDEDRAGWMRALRLSRTERGYRVGEAAEPDVLAALSLQPGDEIVAVDGRSLGEAARALDLFEDLEDVDGASLTVRRDGRAVEIEVDLR